MHLLFSLNFPLLPLQALRPSWSDPGPYAVLDKERVLVVSPEAAQLGVQPGMRAAGVAALAPEVTLLDRDPQKEKSAMDSVVLALYQFTPDIAYEADFGLLLDVGPSLTLFRGVRALSRLVQNAVRHLGFSATLGVAPTAAGAWLLARVSRRRGVVFTNRCLKRSTLQRHLDKVPCALMPAARVHDEWLQGVGAKDLGALRRLPRTGLIRRTSTQLADAIDRAYGEVTELHRWIEVPDTFEATIETFERVEHAEALLEGASRLVLQMVGWLTVRQLAVSVFTLLLQHERGKFAIPPTAVVIALAEPAWQEGHMLRLLKERLAKVELTSPVIGLVLDATQLVPMQPPTLDLFPEPGGSPSDMLRLMELLTARLGPENVLAPEVSEDHRPESCNSWVPAAAKVAPFRPESEALERPFWLLPKPVKLLMRENRPFYGSPLVLIRGPERIEGGWWDDGMAARDYYVAQGSDGSCFWIFQERSGELRWFLHGLYA